MVQQHKADTGVHSSVGEHCADADNVSYSAASSTVGITTITRFNFTVPLITRKYM